MIHPIILLLPRLIPRMPRIIHRQTLPLRPAQYTHDGLRHHLRRHNRPPILSQQGKTNISIGVHMLMTWRGIEKVYRRGRRGVIVWELDAEPVLFVGVNGVFWHGEGDDP